MELSQLNRYLGNIDIYLLDQILKGRFEPSMKLLDAGCGEGRNLVYFLHSGFQVYGVDLDPKSVELVRFVAATKRPDLPKDHFVQGDIANLDFSDNSFEVVIASAVLHFAQDHDHFMGMFGELVRCLCPGGVLFVRMASTIGLEGYVRLLGSGRYELPDGTERFLLTPDLLEGLLTRHSLNFLEPLKTVNVNNQRCMSNLILTKNS